MTSSPASSLQLLQQAKSRINLIRQQQQNWLSCGSIKQKKLKTKICELSVTETNEEINQLITESEAQRSKSGASYWDSSTPALCFLEAIKAWQAGDYRQVSPEESDRKLSKTISHFAAFKVVKPSTGNRHTQINRYMELYCLGGVHFLLKAHRELRINLLVAEVISGSSDYLTLASHIAWRLGHCRSHNDISRNNMARLVSPARPNHYLRVESGQFSGVPASVLLSILITLGMTKEEVFAPIYEDKEVT